MSTINNETVYQWLSEVTDPEVPVLTILDLGVVREVSVNNDVAGTEVKVIITPTYSGCPAMDVIATGIRMTLLSHGVKYIIIEQQLSPAWTTEWMSESGKAKLAAYGIAPPQYQKRAMGLFEEERVTCPRCGSVNTVMVSRFGPTACKSLYKCNDCLEPFEYFKCH